MNTAPVESLADCRTRHRQKATPRASIHLRSDTLDETLAALYDEHGRRLYRYALLILADAAAAEDAVQETFCHLARRGPGDTAAVTFAYASRAIRNECYSMLRRRRTRRNGDAVLLVTLATETTEDERLIVEQALEALPAEQREVIFLKVFEGFTFQEIADLCEISPNTASSRYRYALEALRRVLAPAGETHDR